MLTTRLRLRHSVLGCHLRAANKNLTEWVFKQIEASCDKENNLDDDPYTYWNVESHWNDRCASLASPVSQRIVLTRVTHQYHRAKPSITVRRSCATSGT